MVWTDVGEVNRRSTGWFHRGGKNHAQAVRHLYFQGHSELFRLGRFRFNPDVEV